MCRSSYRPTRSTEDLEAEIHEDLEESGVARLMLVYRPVFRKYGVEMSSVRRGALVILGESVKVLKLRTCREFTDELICLEIGLKMGS